jgi:hypothetical protein
VGHGRDELPRRIPRQLGVGVEGDDVAHAGQPRGVADDRGETVAGAAAQERIEVGELAALSLAAHPAALLGFQLRGRWNRKKMSWPAAA